MPLESMSLFCSCSVELVFHAIQKVTLYVLARDVIVGGHIKVPQLNLVSAVELGLKLETIVSR